MLSWGGGVTADALYTLQALLHTPNKKGEGDFNLGRWSNARVDELIEQLQVERDAAKRDALVREALLVAGARAAARRHPPAPHPLGHAQERLGVVLAGEHGVLLPREDGYDRLRHPPPAAGRHRDAGGGLHRLLALQLRGRSRSRSCCRRRPRRPTGRRCASRSGLDKPVLRAVRDLRRQRGAGQLRHLAAAGPPGVGAARRAAAGHAGARLRRRRPRRCWSASRWASTRR